MAETAKTDEFAVDHATHALAAKAPLELVNNMTGKGGDGSQDASFILTARHIVDIRKYEWHALSFPTSDEGVAVFIGGDEGERGLGVKDFKKTFETLQTHAEKWAPLERDIKDIGNKLLHFADGMAIQAQTVAEVISDIRAQRKEFKELPRNYKQLVELGFHLDPKYLAAFSLTEDDEDSKKDLKYVLDAIFDGVKSLSSATQKINTNLDNFAFNLLNTVKVEVDTRLAVLRKSQRSAVVERQKQLVADKREELARLEKEHRDTIKESFNALAKGGGTGDTSPIGLVVGLATSIFTSIYMRSEADALWERRSELSKQVDVEVAKLGKLDSKTGAMEIVSRRLEVLEDIILNAHLGLRNLALVWNAINESTKLSLSRLDKINDTYTLLMLADRVKLVASPWESIKVDVTFLNGVFVEANKLIDKEKASWI